MGTDNCHGCFLRELLTCKIYNTNGSCPCTNCLVKMTCCKSCKEIRQWELEAGYIISGRGMYKNVPM